jgi:hypothetical protein
MRWRVAVPLVLATLGLACGQVEAPRGGAEGQESRVHEQYLLPPEGFLESQRHERTLPPPEGFLSPLASSPAFDDLGAFMVDQRKDRQVFGFQEEAVAGPEVLTERRAGRQHTVRSHDPGVVWLGYDPLRIQPVSVC